METERLVVLGRAIPQGSKRHVGHGILVESGGLPLKDWRALIGYEARAANVALRKGPLKLRIDFFFQRPKGHLRTGRHLGLRPSAPTHPATRPDIDKLGRAVLDALSGIAYVDDGQIVDLILAKHYAQPEQPSGITIEIESLSEGGHRE